MPFLPITPVSSKWSLRGANPLVRIAATIGMLVVAVGLTEALWLIVDRPVSAPLFLVAIVTASWVCGFRYGILAAIMGGIMIDFFFVIPQYNFSGTREELTRLMIFVSEGAVLAWMAERLRIAGEEINSSNEKLQALTDHQERVREEERKSVAREVHDELGQSLTGLKMKIHILKRQANLIGDDNGPITEGLDELIQMTDSTIATVRRIASELRPSLLDDFGLVAAIEYQVQEFGRQTSIAHDFISNSESIDLGADRNTAVYRIVQEALTNIARHASAQNVSVELEERSDQIRLIIRDDGRGMPAAATRGKSLGMVGMYERCRMIGGELKIESIPAAGTTVRMCVPVNENGNGGGGGL